MVFSMSRPFMGNHGRCLLGKRDMFGEVEGGEELSEGVFFLRAWQGHSDA